MPPLYKTPSFHIIPLFQQKYSQSVIPLPLLFTQFPFLSL